MRQSKVGVIRWPGGTAVQNYHWDHLNGIAFKADSWAPGYHLPSAPPADFMSLDKYIAFCRQVGAAPMVGINIKSGKDFNRTQDSLDEARRLVTYCRDQGYNVKFWYIGNEGYASGFGVSEYAAYIDRYGAMIKSIEPDAVIIGDWKFGPFARHRFEQSVRIAQQSRLLDVMEFHEKWGDQWGMSSGQTMEDWRKESPIYNGDLGKYTRLFHEAMAKAGKPGIKVSFNEWGVDVAGGTPFDAALVASDYLIEIFRNDVYQACYWDLNIGPAASRVLKVSRDNATLLGFNPVAGVFEMVANALGETLYQVSSNNGSVYGFAAAGPDGGNLDIYLLNKAETPMAVNVRAIQFAIPQARASVQAFIQPGRVINRNAGMILPANFSITLDPSSFNRVVIRSGTSRG
jgi:hypothetical protein